MRYRRAIQFPVLFICLYESPLFPIPWEDMFMDVGDFHLNVSYEGEKTLLNKGGSNIDSVHVKCI